MTCRFGSVLAALLVHAQAASTSSSAVRTVSGAAVESSLPGAYDGARQPGHPARAVAAVNLYFDPTGRPARTESDMDLGLGDALGEFTHQITSELKNLEGDALGAPSDD